LKSSLSLQRKHYLEGRSAGADQREGSSQSDVEELPEPAEEAFKIMIVLKKDASSFAKAPSVNKVECCSE
jgi:hypothetical protein